MIVFDLDGCLSDDRWRLPIIKSSGHQEYHEKCHLDSPMNDDVVGWATRQSAALVLITGRPESQRNATLQWLKRHYPSKTFTELLMRPPGDKSPSPALKASLLSSYQRKTGEEVQAAFDNRQDVLDAYAAAGIPESLLFLLDHEGRSQSAKRKRDPVVINRAAEILNGMATTLEERNKVYKDNWRQVPELVKVLFPHGVPAELVTAPQWHLFELQLVKLTRFANSELKHQDSIHDIGVYSAIIESIIEEQEG